MIDPILGSSSSISGIYIETYSAFKGYTSMISLLRKHVCPE